MDYQLSDAKDVYLERLERATSEGIKNLKLQEAKHVKLEKLKDKAHYDTDLNDHKAKVGKQMDAKVKKLEIALEKQKQETEKIQKETDALFRGDKNNPSLTIQGCKVVDVLRVELDEEHKRLKMQLSTEKKLIQKELEKMKVFVEKMKSKVSEANKATLQADAELAKIRSSLENPSLFGKHQESKLPPYLQGVKDREEVIFAASFLL